MSSRTATSLPEATDGASLTSPRMMKNDTVAEGSTPPLAVPPSSTRTTSIVAEPVASAAGVNETVPSSATEGAAANSPGSELPTTAKLIAWPDSETGPALIPVAHDAECEPESSSTVTSPPETNEGASLTPSTVTENDIVTDVSTPPLAVPPSSIRTRLTTAEPSTSAAGVKDRMPSRPTEGPAAKSPVFELPVTRKERPCAASSTGPEEMSAAQPVEYVAEPSSTVTFPPGVKDGASLTATIVMVNDSVAEASTPPSAVPPSSTATTSMTAEPMASALGSKVSKPSAATAGAVVNRPG